MTNSGGEGCKSGCSARLRLVLTAAGFAAVAASRVAMIYSPYFEEIQYERAPMGLEALAILRGETPVMNWSEPYHGTVFSYLLAPFYALHRDPILTYSWVSVGLNFVGTIAVYLFACRLWGSAAGLAALAYLALAPAYFPFYDVNSYALFVTLGGVGCLAALVHLTERPTHPRWIWLTGVSLGVSIWCHQLGVCFAAAVGLVFLARQRLAFFRAEAWRLALGVLIGAAPLVAWNAIFRWIVLRNFTSADYSVRPIRTSLEGLWESIGSLMAANTQFWSNAVGASLWLLYGQIAFVGLVAFAAWQLLAGKDRPAVCIGAGMLLALMATTAALYSKSRWGVNAGFSRYLIPMCFAIPILVGGAVATLARRSSAAAIGLLAALIIPGINDRWHYIEWGKPIAGKGARTGVAELDRLGVTRAYAHDRISLPLTLAARERIIVSDYYGIPYQPYLDAVDDAAAPAIVAHKVLKIPSPDDLARSLRVLDGRYRRAESGPYVIFYHFEPPGLSGGWLSTRGWRLTASVAPESLPAVTDRNPLSVWSTNGVGKKGDWIAVDLSEAHRVEEVHLLSGVRIHDTPGAAVVETSLDGESWTERQRLVALPWYWWNGHPKHDDNGRASFYFEPVEARHVRVRLLEPTVEWNWSVAELFVRAADVPESDAGMLDFRQGLLAERRGLIGINYHSIHASFAPDADSTPWGEVMADYLRAMRANPDNPDFSYRFARALWVNGFVGPSANGRDALLYERLGLDDLAEREFTACAQRDEAASLCLDRALAQARSTAPDARASLEALRRQRFTPARPLGAKLGPVQLEGTGTVPLAARPGATVPVELFWKCRRPLDREYTVFVHFTGPGRFQSDHPPAAGRLPTPRWVPGETIRDDFVVTIPTDAPPGIYTAHVGLWDPTRRSRLRSGWFGDSEVSAFPLRVGE
jgi:F5/8 type C domain/Dolichyl-phosphate-mannose-protein mannosyltransferase